MAAVGIGYSGVLIAEMDEPGTVTLKTSGTYCRGNVVVAYAPRSRTYDITLAKFSGWGLLTALDEDVLEHINDSTFTVSMIRTDDYSYEFYSATMALCGNRQFGVHNDAPFYGVASRMSNATTTALGAMWYPANNTELTTSVSGLGMFALADGNYYFKPGDGFVQGGSWRLTFNW